MQNSNYLINRNDIYFGIIVENKGELCSLGGTASNTYLSSYKAYRLTLFVFDKDMQANDLLNDSPNYPVLNHSSIQECHNPNNKVFVINVFCLGDLLKYFGYGDLLDISDVISIRNKIFTYKFLFENSELFGYERISPCDITSYDYPYNHKEELEKIKPDLRCFARKYIVINSYYYVKTKKEKFPSELFELLSHYVNNRVVIRFGGNFNPSYDERKQGNVRRLRRI